MGKKGIIVIIITALITLMTLLGVFGLNLFEQPPPTVVEPEPPHRAYLRDFLAGTGLTFEPVVRNGFAYYKLHSADEQLAGFIFLGTEEGWVGPIDLFVQTDIAGLIQRVHVWQHTETPLYVMEMDSFLATFAGYKIEEDLIWQEDVHGITGATLTAEAIIAAVNETGRAAYQKGLFTQRAR
ncbi:MAG TPA: FMN-binding protein [Atribacteraceae bacterium]|nr:FMN-binding protein [Atribacteraceae bacterium]